jgi:hypothetical protein
MNMPRRTLSIASLFFIALCHGQSSGFGVKGGLLMSKLRSGDMTSNAIPGALAGGYFALKAGPRLELQPELLVGTMGASYTLPDGDHASVRSVYALIPLSAKIFIGNTFNLQGGMQMGRALMVTQRDGSGSTDLTGTYNAWDFGPVLGLGADLIVGWDLGLRYYNGMRPVLADDVRYYPRNAALIATAGYRMTRLRMPKFNRRRH